MYPKNLILPKIRIYRSQDADYFADTKQMAKTCKVVKLAVLSHFQKNYKTNFLKNWFCLALNDLLS